MILPALYDSVAEAEAAAGMADELRPKYHNPAKYRDIADLLMSYGATVMAHNSDGATPLSEAQAQRDEGDASMMNVLLRYCMIAEQQIRTARSQVMVNLY